jgi:hypothetical protein
MAILTALSDSAAKDSRVVIDGRKEVKTEILEDKGSLRKHKMPSEFVLNESEAWLVRSKDSVTLKPRCRHIIQGRLDIGKQFFHRGFVRRTGADTN